MSDYKNLEEAQEAFEQEFSNVGWVPENKERHINFISQVWQSAYKEGKQSKMTLLPMEAYEQGRKTEREKALKALPRECLKDEIYGATGKTQKSVDKWANFADGYNKCRKEFLKIFNQ